MGGIRAGGSTGERLEKMQEKTLGLYGGTFNPPHLGHTFIAESAVRRYVSRLVVMPCYLSPHKAGVSLPCETASPAQRLEMARVALGHLERTEISTYEIEAGEVSYTHRTIAHLRAAWPGWRIVLILGADQYLALPQWVEFEYWKRDVSYLVFPRAGARVELERGAGHEGLDVLLASEMPPDISSTSLREAFQSENSLDVYIPSRVEDYIRANKLYFCS